MQYNNVSRYTTSEFFLNLVVKEPFPMTSNQTTYSPLDYMPALFYFLKIGNCKLLFHFDRYILVLKIKKRIIDYLLKLQMKKFSNLVVFVIHTIREELSGLIIQGFYFSRLILVIACQFQIKKIFLQLVFVNFEKQNGQ